MSGTWNHRIVAVERNGEIEYGMYEVYYDENGTPISRTEEPATFVGDTWEEVADSVARAYIGRPVLSDDEIGA